MTSFRCRIWWPPTPPAAAPAVLVLLLVIVCSSSAHIADGVRTTPGRDGGILDAASLGAAGARASSRETYYKERPADRSEDDEERSLVVSSEEDQVWWVKERAAAGSRVPDCGHACGACSPCRRVIVSFRCALASESCPIAYRCMCRGRFFRVPSL